MNYYQILGVIPNASIQEIKVAYRSKINRYAVQMNASNKDFEFERARLSKIIEVLSDPIKRKAYDLSISNTNIDENNA